MGVKKKKAKVDNSNIAGKFSERSIKHPEELAKEFPLHFILSKRQKLALSGKPPMPKPRYGTHSAGTSGGPHSAPEINDLFFTKGFVVGSGPGPDPYPVVEVSHLLPDTAAGASVVSQRLVDEAGLDVMTGEPHVCITASGACELDQYLRFDLYIAGVKRGITAYISNAETKTKKGEKVKRPLPFDLVLGDQALKGFNAESKHKFATSGQKGRKQWSISSTKGKVVGTFWLPRADGQSTCTRFEDRTEGMNRAKEKGMTAKDIQEDERRSNEHNRRLGRK